MMVKLLMDLNPLPFHCNISPIIFIMDEHTYRCLFSGKVFDPVADYL